MIGLAAFVMTLQAWGWRWPCWSVNPNCQRCNDAITEVWGKRSPRFSWMRDTARGKR